MVVNETTAADTAGRKGEMIRTNTTPYEISHAKAPRGFGSWAFDLATYKGPTLELVRFWAHSMNYGGAKKAALAEAQKIGAHEVRVLG